MRNHWIMLACRPSRSHSRWSYRFVPPVLTIAILRAVCNCWCTSARFSKVILDCRFCGHLHGDTLLHYLLCDKFRIALRIVWPRVHLPVSKVDIIRWFCLLDRPTAMESKRRCILLDVFHKVFSESKGRSLFSSLGEPIEARIRFLQRLCCKEVNSALDDLMGPPVPWFGRILSAL